MEAAVEKRVMLLSAWAKRCVFKVLVLGNYYACRLKAITCRWPVLLTPTPEFLSVHRRYGVRQLAAALLCPGLPGGAPSYLALWLQRSSSRAYAKQNRARQASVRRSVRTSKSAYESESKLSHSKFPFAGFRLAPSPDFRLTNTLLQVVRGVGCFGRVDVEKRLIHMFWRGGLGEADWVANLALVVLHLALCVVNAGKLPEHFDEVRLPLREEAERHEESIFQSGEAEMLLIENLLSAHELFVEAIERQPGGKDGVLHVKETVIARREVARFGDPSFRARIRGVDGDMHDFGDRQRPFADGFKVALVPIRVGDDIHGGMDIQRAGAFERFDIFFHRDALAVALQTFVVDRFDPEEHIFQAEAFPEFEHFLVSDENIAARLEVILFLDVALLDFAGKSETMVGLNERNIVNDEHSVFLDTC